MIQSPLGAQLGHDVLDLLRGLVGISPPWALQGLARLGTKFSNPETEESE